MKEDKQRKRKTNPKKELAEILFIDADYSQKEIAQELGISENTIVKWADIEGWKQKKAIRTLSPDKLIAAYYDQSDKIIQDAKEAERTLSSKECDALNKLAAAIEKLDKKVSPSINMAVFIRFNNYLKVIDNELVKKLLSYQKDYIQTLISNAS